MGTKKTATTFTAEQFCKDIQAKYNLKAGLNKMRVGPITDRREKTERSLCLFAELYQSGNHCIFFYDVIKKEWGSISSTSAFFKEYAAGSGLVLDGDSKVNFEILKDGPICSLILG